MLLGNSKNSFLLIVTILACFLLIWISTEQSERRTFDIWNRLLEKLPFELGIRAKYPPYDWSQPLRNSNLTCMDSHALLKPKFKICPHKATVNKSDFVSNTIMGNVPWEHFISKGIENFNTKYPKSTFVDIGVNVGTHALYAAALGMPVVGVEPNPDNWNNVHKGVLLNKFQNKITLLPYAVSEERTTIEMVANLGNIAASYVVGGNREQMAQGRRSEPFHIKTMLLEDLLPFIKTKTALLKVDVEAYECHVIGKSYNFFAKLDVPMIFMETGGQRLAEPECVKRMVNFLRDIGYKYIRDSANGRNVTAPAANASATAFVGFPWPFDTVWSLKYE